MHTMTAVLWDLNTCPVPADCEPGRVRAIIESALTKYFGSRRPVTVFAVCNLEVTSPGLLKEISSSGILLRHTPYRGLSVRGLLDNWIKDYPPPATIMLISGDSAWFNNYTNFGFTILRAFPFPRPPYYRFPPAKEWFWESLLKENSGAVVETSGTSVVETSGTQITSAWSCMPCGIPSQSFDGFIEHLKSEEHKEWLLDRSYDYPLLFCQLCEYPGYDDFNMDIHYKSEEHAQKEKERAAAAGVPQNLVAGPSEKEG